MSFLFYLLRVPRVTIFLAVFMGLLSGATNAGFIALINMALHDFENATATLIWGFVGLGFVKLVTSAISRMLLTRFAQQTISDLRSNLSRKILNTPLSDLENIGVPRVLVALTGDVQTIMNALQNVPALTVNVAILIGCAAYLGWLSWTAFLAMLGFIFLWILSHRILVRSALRFLRLARLEQETLFRHFRALTEGIKELKLHGGRRKAFLTEELNPSIEALQQHNIQGRTRLVFAHTWSQLFLFALIGLLLFALPALRDVTTETMTGFVIAVLYMLGPFEAVSLAFPSFGQANIALQRVDELGLSLAARSTEEDLGDAPGKSLEFERLEMQGVTYTYEQETGERNFVLGPINISLYTGELVFLLGGNGSGKSTLAKLVTGLYYPRSGGIRLDGQLITDANREWYHQYFSAVFVDSYLFDDLLGLTASDLDIRAQDYLAKFQLDHKVQVEDGAFSTTALSQGQRRRLMLLTAYLEDRPIYVFDEWAADQDKEFKEIFYTKLLPDLKDRGKAVLVISHDERYFHMADRVIKLEDGRLYSTATVGSNSIYRVKRQEL